MKEYYINNRDMHAVVAMYMAMTIVKASDRPSVASIVEIIQLRDLDCLLEIVPIVEAIKHWGVLPFSKQQQQQGRTFGGSSRPDVRTFPTHQPPK